MIGDREDTDIAFAKNSGMHYIQIKTHKTKKAAVPAENNLTYLSLEGIIILLKYLICQKICPQ